MPPDDPQAMAYALSELRANDKLRLTLGQAARKQAVEKHSWDRTVAELELILYDLFDERER